RDYFIRRQGVLEIETPIFAPRIVFEASGHVEHFREAMVQCTRCRGMFRADHLLVERGGLSSSEAEKLSLDGLDAKLKEMGILCPECGGEFGKPTSFQTMFQTTIGPYSEAVGYGRPEAAQGMFTDFKRLYEVERGRLPMGVAQVGKAVRNEISPRQGPIRLREFTIMEIEFFFDPTEPRCPRLGEVEESKLRLILERDRLQGREEPITVTVRQAVEQGLIKAEWMAYFMALAQAFVEELGVPAERQRFIEKLPWERAHYSAQSFDQEVLLERWGWVEVSGHAYRTDYDLRRHMEFSGQDMTVFRPFAQPRKVKRLKLRPIAQVLGPAFKQNTPAVVEALQKSDPEKVKASFEENGFYELPSGKVYPQQVQILEEELEEAGERFIPHVVEPSFGAERLTYVAMEYAVKEKEDRLVIALPRDIAPTQAIVLPLVTRDGLPERAQQLQRALLDAGLTVAYDDAGSIGRRYVRADEMGVPLAVTIDYQTLTDNTVTLRDRDSWEQVRSPVNGLGEAIRRYCEGKASFAELGAPLKRSE
ncbi:MAG: glycine--tRNA ligase, partial [Candidatus Bathyarchaeia archaeon]